MVATQEKQLHRISTFSTAQDAETLRHLPWRLALARVGSALLLVGLVVILFRL